MASDRGSKRGKKRWNGAKRPVELISTISINPARLNDFIDYRNRSCALAAGCALSSDWIVGTWLGKGGVPGPLAPG
jgi:hypothetical protein